MRALTVVFTLILSSTGFAKFATEPEGCLDKFAPPCSILTETKSEFQNPEFHMYTSKDALFQFQNAQTLYLARGVLWIFAANSLTVQSKYGEVAIAGSGEYWLEMNDNELVVKSLREPLSVRPRGAGSVELRGGFEMRLSNVDEQTHAAAFSVPIVINLPKHLAVLPRAFPESGMNLQDYSTNLGRVVLEAAGESSAMFQDMVQRKVSSAEENERRLKYEAAHNARRDSYLQKLYRSKNNFEDQ